MDIVNVPYPAPSAPFTPRNAADITDFVVHHTAGPLTQTPLEIDAFERGRGDIFMPYTWLIDAAGKVYAGRSPLVVSAATYGRNAQSVACCVIGNFEQDDPGYTGPPSALQIASLEALCILMHRQYPSISRTYAHGDVAALFYGGDPTYATACCGDQLRAKLPAIEAAVAQSLQHAGA